MTQGKWLGQTSTAGVSARPDVAPIPNATIWLHQLRYPVWLMQAAKYSAVGLSNTALDAVLYLILTHFLGLGGLKVLAKTISYGMGTLNSFHWNRSWTFRSKARVAATFVPFVLVSVAALGINAAAMYLSLDLFSQREMPAFALATAITLLWNFGTTKLVIFRR